MESPEPKRSHLSIESKDPSIPLPNNRSPFFNAPNDIIKAIFRSLTKDTKTKMGLELVCLRFGGFIKQRICWENDKKLIFDRTEQGLVKINYKAFDEDKAVKALAKLLERITVNIIEVRDVPYNNRSLMISLCSTIIENKRFFSVNVLNVDTRGSTNRECLAFLLNSLTLCGISQMKEIIINTGNYCCVFSALFLLLQNCRLLKRFTLQNFAGEIDMGKLCESLKNCPKLETLEIETNLNLASTENTELAELFNSLKFLKILSLKLPINSHTQLVNLLSEECRLKMEELHLWMENASQEECDNFAKTATTFFPNLKELDFDFQFFTWEIVQETIENIITHLSGRGKCQFKLNMTCFDHYDTVLANLTNDGATIRSLRTDEYAETGPYSCIKGDMELILDIWNQGA